jgi:hypothetical protein
MLPIPLLFPVPVGVVPRLEHAVNDSISKTASIEIYFFIVFVIPFASLKAQTSYEKCCAPPLFDL